MVDAAMIDLPPMGPPLDQAQWNANVSEIEAARRRPDPHHRRFYTRTLPDLVAGRE